MPTRDLSNELFSIRVRLGEIEVERRTLGPNDVAQRAALREEEGELRARLVRLQDATLKDHDTQEIPGVPGTLSD